jgi:hypothetical protein
MRHHDGIQSKNPARIAAGSYKMRIRSEQDASQAQHDAMNGAQSSD